jgi:7,8-dihydropterin-6-yl-methyl-4-(beta-D-ribofuranosyl)aminobenzene 5'-phosphate synthase
LAAEGGGQTRNLLLDFGFTPAALLNNLEILKIDSVTLDALIVSHVCFDHFGGLVPLLKQERAKMRADLPLYVGGEDTFCYYWRQLPDRQCESFGALDRRDLKAANVRVVMAAMPAVIAGHAFSTGAAPRPRLSEAHSRPLLLPRQQWAGDIPNEEADGGTSSTVTGVASALQPGPPALA